MSSTLRMQHQFFTGTAVTGLAALELDYAAGHISPPFDPIEDDQQLRNDVTVERTSGSRTRHTKLTGPLSVDAPPDGAGRYDESVTVNVQRDVDLPDQTAWRVHLGTVDELRYPAVTVALTDNQNLVDRISIVETGDRAIIANPPVSLPPGDIDLLIQGYTEKLTPYEWEWTANASPGSPWRVAAADDDVLGRLDATGSVLAAGIGTADTSFNVTTPAGSAPWIDDLGFPAEFPLDVRIGGEVMRVTGITGATSPQTFTVERSVNSVQKSHSAGTEVVVEQSAVVAL